MRGSFNQRELLRVINAEKSEIHARNDVGRRRSFRQHIAMAVTAAQRKEQKHRSEKKSDFQTSTFHWTPSAPSQNNRAFQIFQRGSPHAFDMRSSTPSMIDLHSDRRIREPAETAIQSY